MPYTDLENARKHYQEIRELIIHHPGAWPDEKSLRELRDMCRAAAAAVDDAECKERLSAIEDYGADLFSVSGHQKWARKQMSGADFLRLQMLRDLDAFHARLFILEATRNALARQSGGPRNWKAT